MEGCLCRLSFIESSNLALIQSALRLFSAFRHNRRSYALQPQNRGGKQPHQFLSLLAHLLLFPILENLGVTRANSAIPPDAIQTGSLESLSGEPTPGASIPVISGFSRGFFTPDCPLFFLFSYGNFRFSVFPPPLYRRGCGKTEIAWQDAHFTNHPRAEAAGYDLEMASHCLGFRLSLQSGIPAVFRGGEGNELGGLLLQLGVAAGG